MFWIALGFLGNGFAQFFQKYLHALGLGSYQAVALLLMYFVGLLFAIALLKANRAVLSRQSIWSGSLTAVASYIGNYAVLQALGTLPAHVVFPLIVGGPILLVAAWQYFFDRFSLSTRRIAGLVCGLFAVILLTTAD